MKFSIIIPAYKPNYLKECIDSILEQTYTDFELIIVNDASPNNLDSIVNNYQDSRIRYITNENNYGAKEMVNNWNHCLKFVQGEFVINMGDDDKLMPKCLEDYSQLIKKYPNIDVFHTRMAFINETSEIINLTPERAEHESALSAIWHFFHGRVNRIGDWLFKTESLRENGGYYYLPCAWGADDISAFMMAEKNGIVNSTYIGFLYRTNDLTVSKSSANSFEKIQAHCMAKDWYFNFFQKKTKNEKDELYKHLLLKELDSVILRFKCREITNTLKNKPSLCYEWLRKCNKYGISKRTLLGIIKNICYSRFRSLLPF